MRVPAPALLSLLLLASACGGGESAERLVEQAEALLDGDSGPHLQDAAELARRATVLEPNNARAWTLLGEALYYSDRDLDEGFTEQRSGAMAGAEEAWGRAVELDPKNADALLGLALLGGHDGSEAGIRSKVGLLQRAVDGDPSHAEAWMYLGVAHFDLGQYDDAERALLTAVAPPGGEPTEADTLAEAQRYLGRIYTDQRRFDDAERHLKASIDALEIFRAEEQTDNGCPYQALGRLYAQMGQHDRVWDLYETAAEIGGQTPVHLYLAALKAYDLGDHGRARAYLDRAEQRPEQDHPDIADPRGRYNTLRGYLALGDQDFDDAEARFAAAAEADPTGAAVGRGHLAIARQDHAAARTQLAVVAGWAMEQRKVGRESTHLDVERFTYKMACVGMGWTDANEGKHDAALGWFDKVLADQPEDMLAQLGRGNSLLALERPDEAIAAFDRVLAVQPGNRHARSGRAAVLAARGDLEAAEQEYIAAMEEGAAGSQFTCPHRGLGLLYMRQGRVDEARGELEQAVALEPEIGYRKFVMLAKIYIDEHRYDEAERLLHAALRNRPDGERAKQLLDEVKRLRAG